MKGSAGRGLITVNSYCYRLIPIQMSMTTYFDQHVYFFLFFRNYLGSTIEIQLKTTVLINRKSIRVILTLECSLPLKLKDRQNLNKSLNSMIDIVLLAQPSELVFLQQSFRPLSCDHAMLPGMGASFNCNFLISSNMQF